jgi:ABC-2 type transport system ATP-binding protein
MNILKIDKLTKIIKKKTILNEVTLELESGHIYGLVGRNGSGKTMLLRSLSGMMCPTSGGIFYNGKELYKEIDFIPNTGIVIENIGLYPEFTGYKNLKLLAGINKKITDDEIRESITRSGLDPDDKRTVKKYSLGMKQKIVLAQAIMEKPDLLLLDEPTIALDEISVETMRNVWREEAERGAIVVIASHNKEDIEALCEYIYRIEDGVLTPASEVT